MATQCFLATNTSSDWWWGDLYTSPIDSAAWYVQNTVLRTTRGSGVVASPNQSTVNGPTSGREVAGTALTAWLSSPIAADVTISGTMTFNCWAAESNMSANVAINFLVERVKPDGSRTTIIKTVRTTEVAVTTRAANNWTETPASITLSRGDRISVRVFGDDGGGNMASGFTFNFSYAGASAAADGDTYVTFTETITFEGTPAGTQLFLRDSAASGSIDPGSATEKEAWTSRGAASTTAVINVPDGPVVGGTQWTKTAGGTALEWYTRPLTAFSLAGAIKAQFRLYRSASGVAGGAVLEVAVTDNDGTNATVLAKGGLGDTVNPTITNTTDTTAYAGVLGVPTTSIADGQRLRFRLFVDDPLTASVSGSGTNTLSYDGPTASAAGDSWIQLAQSVTEFTPPPSGPGPNVLKKRRGDRFLVMR